MRIPAGRLLPLVAALAVPLALALLAPPAVAGETVTMLAAAFSPKDAPPIKEGDVIKWVDTEADGEDHTVTSKAGAPEAFDQRVANGGEWERVFTKPGAYGYYCRDHSDFNDVGMVGTLTVTNEPPSIALTTAPAAGSSVFGSFTASGTASDAAGSVTVQVSIDGGATWGDAAVSGGTWSATINVEDQPHGPFTFKARVRDDEGTIRETAARTLVVNRAPTASFASSPAQPTSADVLTLNDTSTDPDGVHDLAKWSWSWEFDGAAGPTSRNATKSFPKGSHTVALTVTDDHNAASAKATRTIVVRNSAPRPDFAVSPADVAIHEDTAFLDRTDDVDRDAVNWTWDFGDGGQSFARNATHRYAATGTYTVRLTVRDVDGAVANATKVLEVVEFATQRPVAQLTASPASGVAPLAVRFTVDGLDPDGTVANWTLDFGEGAPLNGPGSLFEGPAAYETTHTYQRNGTFEVVLTLRDNLGATGVNRTLVVVEAPPNRPPQARFEAAPTTAPRKGQSLSFVDTSTDLDFADEPVHWEWDFGDGVRVCCDRKTVTHAYGSVGRFVVRLTVRDTLGEPAAVELPIDVRGETPRVLLAPNNTGGRAPWPVSFTLDARDPDGGIQRWSLDFGDGTPPLRGEGAPPNTTVRHVYEQAGTFAATLDAVDDDGLGGRVAVPLTVTARAADAVPLPPSAITASPAGTRLTYRFGVTTTLAGDLTYQWAFGDGRTGAGRDVTYSYDQAGAYTVTLTILGPSGPVARASTGIVVGDEASGPRERVRGEVASGVVRVAWQQDPRAGGYQVWRSLDGVRFEEVAVVTGAAAWEDLDVRDGQAYAYRVTFFGADGEGRLQRLSQLNSTQAFRMLGEVRATGLVDTDGDGVGDTRDLYPEDAGRWEASPSLLGPLAVVVVLGAAAVGAWRYRDRLVPPRGPARPLTHVPGLYSEQAAILAGIGIASLPALAAADPADVARRTVLPQHVVEPWVAAARLMLLPGISPREADLMVRAGVRGPEDLAAADPRRLALEVSPPVALPRAERWVRAARRARDGGAAG